VITVWGRASSVNVQKVLWALGELAESCRREVVGGPYGGLDRPEFVRLTPVGKVPVLVDGETVLWESHAILRHLARTRGGIIAPRGTRAMSLADQWLDYTATTLQPPFIRLFWQKVRLPAAQRDAAVAEGAAAAFLDALDPLEQRLSETQWLAGDRFSIADIGPGSLMKRATDIATPLERRPSLARWYKALNQREAFRDTILTSYEELRG
jgi:glutathione S-transferase